MFHGFRNGTIGAARAIVKHAPKAALDILADLAVTGRLSNNGRKTLLINGIDNVVITLVKKGWITVPTK